MVEVEVVVYSRHAEEGRFVESGRTRLFGGPLEEGDEVVAVVGLLESSERHLGAGDVLLGVLEVLELWGNGC